MENIWNALRTAAAWLQESIAAAAAWSANLLIEAPPTAEEEHLWATWGWWGDHHPGWQWQAEWEEEDDHWGPWRAPDDDDEPPPKPKWPYLGA